MAQSIHCRTLSALILLAIVVPVSPALLPTRALPAVEAAEAELDTVAPGAAVPPGFAATRPAEGEIRVSLKPGRNVEEPWAFLPIATGEQQGIDSTTMPIPVYSPPDTPLLTAQPAGEYLFVAFGYEHRHGVMRYDGEGWAWVTDGLYLQDTIAVSQIAADPGNPTTLLLSTPNGIYRTTDALGRCYWDKVLAITGTTTIEAHPTVSGTFFAATVPLANCPGGGSCSRFYKSSDWGTTWSGPVKLPYVSTGDNPQEICVWVDPQGEDEDVVYIPNFNLGVSGGQYFWRSIDAGDTFTKVRTLAFRPYGGCAVDPITDVVYMGGYGGTLYQVAKSEDRGDSWNGIDPRSNKEYYDIGGSPHEVDEGQVWMVQSQWGNKDYVWESDFPVLTTTWEPITITFPSQYDNLEALDFGGPDEVWVAGDNRRIFHITANQNDWAIGTLEIPYGLFPGSWRVIPADIVSLGRYYYPISDSLFAQVEVSPVITRADGLATAAVTVTVQNYTGTVIPNVPVTITAAGARLEFTQPTSPTDSSGQTVGYVQGSVDGVFYISAQATTVTNFLSNAARLEFVGPDLQVAQQAPPTVTAGMYVTYTLWISNVGWAQASQVVVTDTLSPYVQYITQSSPFSTTYNPVSGTVVWDAGYLAEGAVVSWTVTTQAHGTVLTNTVVAHTTDVEHNGQEGNATAVRTLALNYLVAAPGEPLLGTALWRSNNLTITVENQGEDPLHDLDVHLPESMEWLDADISGLAGSLLQGQTAVLTLTAAPDDPGLKGYHQGYVEIASAEGTTAYVALTVFVGDVVSGTAAFTVTEDVSNTAVSQAQVTAVWVGHEISGTDWLVFQGQTDAAGQLTFAGVPTGTYYYQVRKPGLVSTWSEFQVREGETSGVNVTMTVQGIWFDWLVGEGDITDTYDLFLTITYRLRNDPLLVYCGPWLEVPLEGGTTYTGVLTLANPTGYTLSNVLVVTSGLVPGLSMSFENNGNIAIGAHATADIPFVATAYPPILEEDYEAGALRIEGDYFTGTISMTYAVSLNVLLNPVRGLNCHCVTDPEYYRTYCSSEGVPCGEGGCEGGWSPPPFQPPPWEPPQQLPGTPGRAQLVMSQPAALTRQAFWAKLTIGNNGLLPISAVDVDLVITGTEGITQTGFFTDSSQAKWTYVPPGLSQTWQWTLVPEACAGGIDPSGRDYRVYVTGSFRYGPEIRTFTTIPGTITVIPQPRLYLSYYWPAEVEIFDPFQVLMSVRNWAYGPASNFKMKAPTWEVTGPPEANVVLLSSALDIGTVAPQGEAVGWMEFMPNYTGAITDVHVSLVHRPFQGIELNPLLISVTAFVVYSDYVALVDSDFLPDPGAGCVPPPPVPGPGLLWVYAPPPNATIPGGMLVYNYRVFNMSGMTVTSTLAVTSSHGWDWEAPELVQIAAGGWVRIPVTLTVPTTATVGTIDILTLQAARQDLPQIRAHDWTRTLVSTVSGYGLILTPGAAAFQIHEGRYIPFDLPVVVTLTNNTIISATGATVSITPPVLLELSSGQEAEQNISGTLAPGQSGVVSWTVRPPHAAQEEAVGLEYLVHATDPEHVEVYASGTIAVPAIMTEITLSSPMLVLAPNDPLSDSLYMDYIYSATVEPPADPWSGERNPITVTVTVTNIGDVTYAVTLMVTLTTPAEVLITPITMTVQMVPDLFYHEPVTLQWKLLPATAEPPGDDVWSWPISVQAAAWNAHRQTAAGEIPIRKSYESGYRMLRYDGYFQNNVGVSRSDLFSAAYYQLYRQAFPDTDGGDLDAYWNWPLLRDYFVSFFEGQCAGFAASNGALFANPSGGSRPTPLEDIADWNSVSGATYPFSLTVAEDLVIGGVYHWRNFSSQVWGDTILRYVAMRAGVFDNQTVYYNTKVRVRSRLQDPAAILLGPDVFPLPPLPSCPCYCELDDPPCWQECWDCLSTFGWEYYEEILRWQEAVTRTHMVLPYKVVETGSRYDIYVYNPNAPYPPLAQAQRIELDPNDDWSYKFWTGGDDDGYWDPYRTAEGSALAEQPVSVWYTGTSFFLEDYAWVIIPIISPTLTPVSIGIADSQGRVTGIGESRSDFEIPDSGPFALPGYLGYTVPNGDDYRVMAMAYATGTYTLNVWGKMNDFLLQDATVITGTVDAVSITHNFTSYALTTTDSTKAFTTTLTHVYTGTGRARSLVIANAALSASEVAIFAYESGTDLFGYTNVGGTKTYGLRLEQLTVISDGEFSAITTVVTLPDVAMGSDETHFFAVQDWDHLPTSTIYLLVDQGNDGTIEEMRILQDKEPPFSEATSVPYANTAPITVTFAASDTVSGVAYTELWARTPLTTTWMTTGVVLTGTAGVFTYTPADGDGTYYLATVAVDNAGNREATPMGDGDTATVYDTVPPSSTVAALPPYRMGTFTVTWSGSDATAGIATYDVQYRIDNDEWQTLLAGVTMTQALFEGDKERSTYYFRCRASDRAGNIEEWPEDPDYDTFTVLDLTPPTSSASALDYDTGGTIPVSWTASDGLAGVASTELWVRTPPTTTWAASGLVLTGTSGVFACTPTVGDGTYFFATVAVDSAGNREAAPTGPGDDSTVYDTTPPSSQVEALPAYSLATFTVTWSGSDATSGLEDYDVQVCTVDCISGWSDWLTQTTTTTQIFTGSHGITYSFRSRARDVAGNVEPWPASADTATTVDTAPPETAVDTMPAYYTTTTFPVFWQGADVLSGLHHYNLYYRAESAVNWTLWLENVTYTQTTFTGTRGYTYHFCSQGVDNLGNAEDSPFNSSTTNWPIVSDANAGVTPWSRVNDLPAYTGSRTFTVSWSGGPPQPGQGAPLYNVQVRDSLYGLWLPWKSGVIYTSADYTGQYGHIYYFRCQQQAWGRWELYPLGYDTYTKLVAPAEGEGAAGGGGVLVQLPPDEAPDRMEEVTQTQALGTLTGYIAPADDVDWYRFELTATKRLRVALADLPADFDVYVFDGSGQFLWASTWGRRLPEEIVARVPAGVYYVQLVGYAGDWSGELPYRLAVERVGGGAQGGEAGSLGTPAGAPLPW